MAVRLLTRRWMNLRFSGFSLGAAKSRFSYLFLVNPPMGNHATRAGTTLGNSPWKFSAFASVVSDRRVCALVLRSRPFPLFGGSLPEPGFSRLFPVGPGAGPVPLEVFSPSFCFLGVNRLLV